MPQKRDLTDLNCHTTPHHSHRNSRRPPCGAIANGYGHKQYSKSAWLFSLIILGTIFLHIQPQCIATDCYGQSVDEYFRPCLRPPLPPHSSIFLSIGSVSSLIQGRGTRADNIRLVFRQFLLSTALFACNDQKSSHTTHQ